MRRAMRSSATLSLFGSLGVLALLGCGRHPSDVTLLERFAANRAKFALLVAMSDVDQRVIRIAHDFTRVEGGLVWPAGNSLQGISTERWAQYRALFRQLGLESGLYRGRLPNGTPVVVLVASSLGIVNHGSSKGYAYSTGKISPVFESLDNQAAVMGDNGHGAAFRAIGDGWYLELDW